MYIYIYISLGQGFMGLVPIGSLQWSILLWFPWWLRHGAMDPCEGTLFRENADKRTSEFTHFNLVIRLGIVKQLAVLLWAILSCRSCRWCVTLASSILLQRRCSEQPETRSFTGTERQPVLDHYISGWGYMLSGVVYFLLMVLWWGWTYRASNSSELEQPFNDHLWVWPTTVPSRE